MPRVALIGNPNSGKSSLFNALTGTRQKVANYPGVTVDVKTGILKGGNQQSVVLLDMPGLYSVYPSSEDGRLVMDILLDPGHRDHPDAILYVVDATQIESQLMMFTQLSDMGFRIGLVVNMIDSPGFEIDYELLARKIQAPVLPVSGKTLENLDQIISAFPALLEQIPGSRSVFFKPEISGEATDEVAKLESVYNRYVRATRDQIEGNAPPDVRHGIMSEQVRETMSRADQIKRMLAGAIRSVGGSDISGRIDRLVTHWFFGPILFAVIMLLVFQAIFAWATYPMDAIEWAFSKAAVLVHQVLGDGWIASFLADGLLAGLSGVLMFVPQIAILFFLISILEETGYMARVVFLFDRFLQRFGMNGRSVVALISGGACAIPAIMSTRTIENRKERLITILVTPFISCSARIPVFTVLVAFVVPYEKIWGVFYTQGLVFAGLYVMGIATALGAAWVFKQILKSRDASFLVLELPKYRKPDWVNVWMEVKSKSGTFIREAGKVIVVISLVLWFLASFSFPGRMQQAEQLARVDAQTELLNIGDTDDLVAGYKLEASFAGVLGKFIEPAIRPLGYDWKIGIALITSFAAREVFVGSMATIYSVGTDTDEFKLRSYLAEVRNPETGKRVFNMATSLSLIFFYLLALQCMSTMAVVKKETGSWKWPIIQFVMMGGLAYLVSWIAYQFFSH
jgi:ferrous iron transport protein B